LRPAEPWRTVRGEHGQADRGDAEPSALETACLDPRRKRRESEERARDREREVDGIEGADDRLL